DRPRADVQPETSALRRDQRGFRANGGGRGLCPPALNRRRRQLPRHRRAGHRAGAQGGKPRLLPAGGPRRARRRGRDAHARGDLGRLLRSVRTMILRAICFGALRAADSVRSPPSCGEGVGVGVAVKRKEEPPPPTPPHAAKTRRRRGAHGVRGPQNVTAMEWVNIIIQGVLIGGLYAMFAAGLALIFGVMRLVNIAHGDLIVLAAYIALMTTDTLGLNPLLAIMIV